MVWKRWDFEPAQLNAMMKWTPEMFEFAKASIIWGNEYDKNIKDFNSGKKPYLNPIHEKYLKSMGKL